MPIISNIEQLPVREARAGETKAWATLLARYRLPLYAYVFELIRQEQTSEDIVQESFISAAQHIGSLQQDEKFGSWLFNIAHQKCLQHWRKRPFAEITLDDRLEELTENENPRDLLIRQEQEEAFMSLLEQLELPHRAVLLLHFIEDFSLEEIATITGTPIGTVKSRLYYARKAMRKLIEEKET